jgi:hypothetical protein
MDEGREFRIVSLIRQRIFTRRKILRHGTSGFTFHPKEGTLLIVIAIKKSIASAGFEPATPGSSGRHTMHYTTETTPLTIIKIKVHERK